MILNEFNSWDPVGLDPLSRAEIVEEYSTYSDRIAGLLYNNRARLDESKIELKKLIIEMMEDAFDVSDINTDSLQILSSKIILNSKGIL